MAKKIVPEFVEIEKILIDSYKSLNIAVEIIDLPLPRMTEDLSSGQLDAVICRAHLPNNEPPNIIQIKVDLLKLNLYMVGIDKNPDSLSIDQIKKSRFVHVRGHLRAEEFLKSQSILNSIAVSTFSQAITMVNEGRADFTFTLNTQDYYLKGNFDGETKKLLQRSHFSKNPVSEQVCYHYVHKKHLNIIPKLTETIKKALQNKVP